LIAFVGGQGTAIIFFTSLGAAIKKYSIICSSILTCVLFTYILACDTYHYLLQSLIIFRNFNQADPYTYVTKILLYSIPVNILIFALTAWNFPKHAESETTQFGTQVSRGIIHKRTLKLMPLVSFIFIALLIFQMFSEKTQLPVILMLTVGILNFWVPFFGLIGNDELAAVVGNPSKVDLLMSTKGQRKLTGKGDRAFWFTAYHIFVVIGVANLTRSALEHKSYKQQSFTFQEQQIFSAL
jgi:hypothetical protein